MCSSTNHHHSFVTTCKHGIGAGLGWDWVGIGLGWKYPITSVTRIGKNRPFGKILCDSFGHFLGFLAI